MHNQRLLQFANFLDSLDDRQQELFNMSHWYADGRLAYPTDDQAPDAEDYLGRALYDPALDPEKMVTCGTAGCALGWAAVNPAFQEQGLKAMLAQEEGLFGGHYYHLVPYCGGEVGEEAGMAFFDLTEAQADYLFLPSEYMDETPDGPEFTHPIVPQRVASRIRTLLKYPDIYLSDKAKLY